MSPAPSALLVGNLQAKIAELEERLQVSGGQHAEQVRSMEGIMQRQAAVLEARNQQIQVQEREIGTWRHQLDHHAAKFREVLADLEAENQRLLVAQGSETEVSLEEGLPERISERIDQLVLILKVILALDLQKTPEKRPGALKLPSEDDFDRWWNSIHWSGGPDLLEWDHLARRAWEAALSRVKIT